METTNTTKAALTAESLALFIELANDAGNWGGTPYISISREKRGNLTQIKRAKLLTTFESDGSTFASFTDAGRALAAAHGIEV